MLTNGERVIFLVRMDKSSNQDQNVSNCDSVLMQRILIRSMWANRRCDVRARDWVQDAWSSGIVQDEVCWVLLLLLLLWLLLLMRRMVMKADWPTLRSLMPNREMALVDWLSATMLFIDCRECGWWGYSKIVQSCRWTWALACESQCWYSKIWLNLWSKMEWSRVRWKLSTAGMRHGLRWASANGWSRKSGHSGKTGMANDRLDQWHDGNEYMLQDDLSQSCHHRQIVLVHSTSTSTCDILSTWSASILVTECHWWWPCRCSETRCTCMADLTHWWWSNIDRRWLRWTRTSAICFEVGQTITDTMRLNHLLLPDDAQDGQSALATWVSTWSMHDYPNEREGESWVRGNACAMAWSCAGQTSPADSNRVDQPARCLIMCTHMHLVRRREWKWRCYSTWPKVVSNMDCRVAWLSHTRSVQHTRAVCLAGKVTQPIQTQQ